MGVNITGLLSKKIISLDDLKNKRIAVDASIFLYQFLTTIRQRDGTPLMDSKNRVTSHLAGLFSRNCNLIKNGLKLIYVFDGEPPKLKEEEHEKRKKNKEEAKAKYEIAKKKKDIAEMKKFAARTTKLTKDMVEDAKSLIEAFGLPIIQAPSEGEAQAAYLAKNNEAYAVASQDADSLLFASPNLIRNLSVSGKKKRIKKEFYETITPELISLTETLEKLQINQDQLIILGMLVGTDYNVGGIKGIGKKGALKLVTKYKDFDELFKDVKWNDYFNVDWEDIFNLFKKMPVEKDYSLKFNQINKEKIIKILVEEHDFSLERVEKQLNGLLEEKKQKGLGEWF